MSRPGGGSPEAGAGAPGKDDGHSAVTDGYRLRFGSAVAQSPQRNRTSFPVLPGREEGKLAPRRSIRPPSGSISKYLRVSHPPLSTRMGLSLGLSLAQLDKQLLQAFTNDAWSSGKPKPLLALGSKS